MNSNKNIETLSKLRNFICHHSDFSKALTSIDECMQMSYMENLIYAELSGDFPLGDSRQPIYKSLQPFDLVS